MAIVSTVCSVMINVILIKLRLNLKYLAEIEEWIQTIADCLLRQKEKNKIRIRVVIGLELEYCRNYL